MATVPSENNPVDAMLDRVMEQGDSQQQQDANTGDNDGGEQTGASETVVDTSGNAGGKAQTTKRTGAADNASNGGGKGQQGARPAQQGRAAGTKTDAQGNLVDAQGNIVASAGAARRVVENLQQNNTQLRDEMRVMQSRLKGFEDAHAYVSQPGSKVTAAEIPMAVQLLNYFRTDPGKCITDMVALARSTGVDLQLDGSVTDMKAIEQMLDRKLGETVGPMRQAHDRAQNAREVLGKANREIETLKREFDRDGRVSANEDALAEYMVYQNRNGRQFSSLREAWLEFVTRAHEGGFDIRTDVRQQIAARRNGNGQQQRNGAATRVNGGVPTGRGTTTPRREVQQRGESMPEGTPAEDRVAKAFRMHGLPIQ